MSLRGFTRAGHLPTLVAALLYFDVSFMTWVLLGPLAPFLREDLGLTASQQGLLTAIPLLGGSLFRPILGIVADRIGGRRTGLIGMALTLATLFVGWRFANTVYHFYALGFFLGLAGASFAVALPLASRWYPAEYQGLAMGIAGAGNSGTLKATLFAPRLAERLGWAPTFGIAMLPVATVFVVFAWLARDSPKRVAATSLRSYGAVLREHDTLWLSFLYSLTFGGFVGFASFLTTFFHEQYQLTRVTAGDFTTLVVVSGSLLRPVGGWLADRLLKRYGQNAYCWVSAVSVAAAIPFAVVALTVPSPTIYFPALALAQFLLFVSTSPINTAIVSFVAPQDRASAMAVSVFMIHALGDVISPPLIGLVSDHSSLAHGVLLVPIALVACAFFWWRSANVQPAHEPA